MTTPARRAELRELQRLADEQEDILRSEREADREGKVETLTSYLKDFAAAIHEDVKHDNRGGVESAAIALSRHLYDIFLGEVR